MSNIKGWFQGLKQKNKDEEDNREEVTTSTVITTEEQVTNSTSNQEEMNNDLPESEQSSELQQKLIKEMGETHDGGAGRGDGVTTTHVASASDQFLNMTAMVLDSVPGLEPDTFIESSSVLNEKDEVFQEANQAQEASPDSLETDHKTVPQTDRIDAIDNLPNQLQNEDPVSSNASEHGVVNDNNQERRLLMAEMLKVSLDQPNNVSKSLVCEQN